MAKSPPKQGSNRTGTKNSPTAGKPGFKARVIDWEQVAKLAEIHCTIEEICSVLDIVRDWLDTLCERDNEMKIGEFVEKHRGVGRRNLRHAQLNSAIEGKSVQMQIFLGKNWLEQSEKVEHYAKPEPIIIERLNGDTLELGSEFKADI